MSASAILVRSPAQLPSPVYVPISRDVRLRLEDGEFWFGEYPITINAMAQLLHFGPNEATIRAVIRSTTRPDMLVNIWNSMFQNSDITPGFVVVEEDPDGRDRIVGAYCGGQNLCDIRRYFDVCNHEADFRGGRIVGTVRREDCVDMCVSCGDFGPGGYASAGVVFRYRYHLTGVNFIGFRVYTLDRYWMFAPITDGGYRLSLPDDRRKVSKAMSDACDILWDTDWDEYGYELSRVKRNLRLAAPDMPCTNRKQRSGAAASAARAVRRAGWSGNASEVYDWIMKGSTATPALEEMCENLFDMSAEAVSLRGGRPLLAHLAVTENLPTGYDRLHAGNVAYTLWRELVDA